LAGGHDPKEITRTQQYTEVCKDSIQNYAEGTGQSFPIGQSQFESSDSAAPIRQPHSTSGNSSLQKDS